MATRRATQYPGAMPEEIAFAKRRTDARRRPLRLDGTFVVALLISLFLLVPAVAVGWSVGKVGGVGGLAIAVMAGSLVSVLLTFLAARAWLQFAPGDRLFADATLTGWIRRARAERQVAIAREVFDDPEVVSIELHVDRLIAISKAVEARDARTHRHSSRVAIHATSAAKHLGLNRDAMTRLRAAAKLHDIGALSEPVLLDPTEDEQLAVALAGADLVAFTGDRRLIAALRHQHENFDGSGSPEGLTGDAIPLAARIIAAADAYDTVSRERGQTAALAELNAGAGSRFDPEIVEAIVTDSRATPITALRGAVAGVAPKAAQGATDLLRGSASVAAAASIATGAVVATGAGPAPPLKDSGAPARTQAAAVASTPGSNSGKPGNSTPASKQRDSKSPESEGKNGATTPKPDQPPSSKNVGEERGNGDSTTRSESPEKVKLPVPAAPVEELADGLGETVDNTTQTAEQIVTEVVEEVTRTTENAAGTLDDVAGGVVGK